jgi:aerobic carbon-monoxide dehydrogenase medium subunit
MTMWMAPRTLGEALELKAGRPEATVVAGGTFLGILARQGLLQPDAWLSLQHLDELRGVDVKAGAQLELGAMVTHRTVELHREVAAGWPGLRRAFSVVASPRVRNVATVGGVLADADYASDPPAMLVALGAWVEAVSLHGLRRIPVADLITGHYETALSDDELLVRVVVPGGRHRAVYRKLRTRSAEDRPCVTVAAVERQGAVRVVVGAVAERPQYLPEACAQWEPSSPQSAREVAERYATGIDTISDSRGSAAYRRRVIAVEVRRALEELAP